MKQTLLPHTVYVCNPTTWKWEAVPVAVGVKRVPVRVLWAGRWHTVRSAGRYEVSGVRAFIRAKGAELHVTYGNGFYL